MRTVEQKEWLEEAKKRFGEDWKQWKFVCPVCKTVQTAQDLIDRGVEEQKVQSYLAFSCIGRFGDKDKGCDWTLGGLLKIHTLEVIIPSDKDEPAYNRPVFEFSE